MSTSGERRRAAAGRPVVIAVAAVAAVAVTGGAVAGGYFMLRDDSGPSAQATGAAPTGAASTGPPATGAERDVSVFFCVTTSSNRSCRSTNAEQEQKDAARRRIEGMRRVVRVRYESQQAAFANFKEKFKDRPDLLDGVEVSDLPDSLQVRVTDIEGARAVKTALDGTPGIDTVIIVPRPPRA